jgi:hypothetical protein
MGYRTLPCLIDSDFCLIFGIRDAQESLSDSVLPLDGNSGNDGMIHLLHIMGLKLSEEDVQSSLVLGDKETSTGITIDPMHEGWTECETIISSPQIILYLIYDIGLSGLVISCMDIDSWWFVDDHDIFIFIDDREWYDIFF